ncbi:MAG: glycosyltransferase [Alphaproteobacteria bacterium]|nr:glycosyltransferase [Alphaproteobacteria bacterium]
MSAPGGILRVLHTRVVTGVGGGPEKTILNSPRFLRGTAYEEYACYYRPPGDPGFAIIQQRAAEAECPLTGIDDSAPWDPSPLRATARLCRSLGIRMWHGHDYKSNLFGLLLQPFFRFHLVTTVHGWVKHTSRTPLYYAIDRRSLRHYHLVIAVSSDLVDACRDAGVPASRLLLIENGIDTDAFAPSARRDEGPRARRVIGCVGRLSPEKGFDIAIAALAHLVRAGHDVELRIAGEGSEAERLKAVAASQGIADRVKLLGYCADVRGLLDDVDVFCLSSLREGLPNVVLEAMAMRRPIVATSAGGMGAFGRDGKDMLLVAPGSADALADALARVLADPSLADALAGAARARAESDLSFRRRMRLMKEAYDRLVAPGPDHALSR